MHPHLAQINEYFARVGYAYMQTPRHRERMSVVLSLVQQEIHNRQYVAVLDLACGNGEIARLISQQSAVRLTGIDFYEGACRIIHQAGLPVVRADLNEGIPFQPESFHLVLAAEILEHIFDTSRFLAEVRRVLKPGGVLIVTAGNVSMLSDRARFMFGFLPRRITAPENQVTHYIRFFNAISLRDFLQKAQFKIEKFTSNYVYFVFIDRPLFRSSTLAKIWPTLGHCLIFKARKSK